MDGKSGTMGRSLLQNDPTSTMTTASLIFLVVMSIAVGLFFIAMITYYLVKNNNKDPDALTPAEKAGEDVHVLRMAGALNRSMEMLHVSRSALSENVVKRMRVGSSTSYAPPSIAFPNNAHVVPRSSSVCAPAKPPIALPIFPTYEAIPAGPSLDFAEDSYMQSFNSPQHSTSDQTASLLPSNEVAPRQSSGPVGQQALLPFGSIQPMRIPAKVSSKRLAPPTGEAAPMLAHPTPDALPPPSPMALREEEEANNAIIHIGNSATGSGTSSVQALHTRAVNPFASSVVSSPDPSFHFTSFPHL